MSEHTPAPWRKHKWDIIGSDNSIVCKVLPWDEMGCRREDVANANLIAAAPELLEALEECAEDLDHEIKTRYGDEPRYARKLQLDMEPVLKARAAIAKARGE